MRMTGATWSFPAVLLVTVLIGSGGCEKKAKEPEIISLEGRIEKIKVTSEAAGEITVVFFSEKQGKEISGTAVVTETTEILVNGAASKLKDLHEGERIKGQVRVDKKGKETSHTALRIQAQRVASEDGG